MRTICVHSINILLRYKARDMRVPAAMFVLCFYCALFLLISQYGEGALLFDSASVTESASVEVDPCEEIIFFKTFVHARSSGSVDCFNVALKVLKRAACCLILVHFCFLIFLVTRNNLVTPGDMDKTERSRSISFKESPGSMDTVFVFHDLPGIGAFKDHLSIFGCYPGMYLYFATDF